MTVRPADKRQKKLIRCPKCGEIGMLQWKAVRSYYYPSESAYFIIPRHKRLSKDGKGVKSKEYWYQYVGHVSPKYVGQEIKDKDGNLIRTKRSRRKWCKYPTTKRRHTTKTEILAKEKRWKRVVKRKILESF